MSAPELPSLLERARAALRQGPPRDALSYLGRAAELAPDHPKVLELTGIAFVRTGKRAEGLEMLGKAAEQAPDDLQIAHNRQVAETGEGEYQIEEIHRLGFVQEAGPAWTTIGWIICGAAILASAGVQGLQPVYLEQVETGKSVLDGIRLHRDPFSVFLVFFMIVSSVGSYAWVLTDLYDRRGRITWTVPMMICTFCGCLVGLPHALYMAIGRR